jgi:tyrosyl-tRNA synthetase
MEDLTPEQKLELIKEQLAEVMQPSIIENIVLKEQRPLAIYWGIILPSLTL